MDDNELIKDDETKIDNKEKLGAFVFKYIILYWKRIIVLLIVSGLAALLASGITISYGNFTCSKTPLKASNTEK